MAADGVVQYELSDLMEFACTKVKLKHGFFMSRGNKQAECPSDGKWLLSHIDSCNTKVLQARC